MFTHYLGNAAKDNTLIDNQVTCLYRSTEGLWAGTTNGPHLISFSKENKVMIKHYKLTGNQTNEELQYTIAVVEDDSGNIIAGTPKGLYIKYAGENEFRIAPGMDIVVRKILKDPSGNIWILSSSNIYFYSASLQKIQNYLSNPYILNFKPEDSIRQIMPISESLLLLATEKKVYWIIHNYNRFEFEEVTFSENNFFENNMLKDLLLDKSMNVWLTSQMDGIARFDLNAKSIYHYPLKHRKAADKIFVQSMIFDHKHRLWVGTSNGVYIEDVNSNETTRVESINEIIYGVFEDYNRNIWVTTLNNIYFIPKGDIARVRKIDEKYNLPKGAYPFDGPYAICDDKTRKIVWIGTRSGVLQIKGNDNDFKFSLEDIQPYESLRAINNVTSLHYSEKDNSLLIGTKNAGLLQAELTASGDIEKIIPLGKINKEKEEHIWTIMEASDGSIYIGTDSGIKKLIYDVNGNRDLVSISNDYRMQSYKIASIVEDNEKNLWLSTSMGLLRYSLSNKQVTQFLNTDGLITNILCEGAIFDSPKNILYIGSIKGINIVNLSSLNINNVAPETQFTAIRINSTPILPQTPFNGRIVLDKSIESTEKIQLNYNENNFTIEFAALHFSNPSKNSFSYKLYGFSNEWTEVNNNIRSATFTNVPPGSYKLLVKSSNGDGVWSKAPKGMTIIIKPAPWNTIWAYLLYALVIAVILYFVYKHYNDKHKIKNELFLRQMEHKKEMEIAEVKLKYHTNITHELRTPLSLIIAPTDELLHKSYKDNYLNTQLNIIKSNADRLLQLINQFLDFRKVINEKYTLSIRHENLSIMLNEIKNYFSGIAKQKNIAIEFFNDLSNEYGWCDKEIITKICSNLLSNAIKYTESQGKISIYASQNYDNSRLYISIEDTGVGIDEAELNKIFNRFYQVPGSTGGTGVGLNLCQQLSAIHSGKISVKSRVGEGSIFTLEVPINRSSYEEDVISETKSVAEDDILVEIDTEITETRDKPMILVVEDNHELCEYIVNLLKDNATVIFAYNGEEGYNLAINNIPDIIVSDIMMPVMDGIEFTQKCKNDMRTSHIPIILLTAKETHENEIEGLTYGADDYITKPFNSKILKLRIKNLLKLTKKKKDEVTEEPEKLNEREQKFLDTFENIVLENISTPDFGIEDICRIMIMSRMQLYRKMTAITNKKPSQYIKEIKMKRAYSLMKDKGLNITEVMYEVGYSNYSYFSRRFSDVNGISPREVLGMKK